MTIRAVREEDHEALWPMLRDVIRPGDTYAIDPGLSRAQMLALWCDAPAACFVAVAGEEILGTYYIKTNQQGGGSHVCNCGYITAQAARGRGVARAMCAHSQRVAVEMGYAAMQFNFVVASNVGAIALWTDMGFATVGRLPGAFCHPEQGMVDALVMFKTLTGAAA